MCACVLFLILKFVVEICDLINGYFNYYSMVNLSLYLLTLLFFFSLLSVVLVERIVTFWCIDIIFSVTVVHNLTS